MKPTILLILFCSLFFGCGEKETVVGEGGPTVYYYLLNKSSTDLYVRTWFPLPPNDTILLHSDSLTYYAKKHAFLTNASPSVQFGAPLELLSKDSAVYKVVYEQYRYVDSQWLVEDFDSTGWAEYYTLVVYDSMLR